MVILTVRIVIIGIIIIMIVLVKASIRQKFNIYSNIIITVIIILI